MKRMMLLAAILLLGVGSVHAAVLTEADLTPATISRTIQATAEGQARLNYARQVMVSIGAMPGEAGAKTQRLVSAARALIGGAGNRQGLAMIAEIYTSAPLENLQGLSDLLADNGFGQEENKMTDAQYDAFCAKVVKTASDYIAASGTSAPDVRIATLVDAFSKGSSDPARTRPALVAVLPAGYVNAVEQYGNAAAAGQTRAFVAERAGVDAVAPTPADPDANNVVMNRPQSQAEEVADDYLERTSPDVRDTANGASAAPSAFETIPAPDGVQVPLLSRCVTDNLGLTQDAMSDAVDNLFYDWETHPATMPGRVFQYETGLPISVGIDEQIPEPFPRPRPMPPSPLYRNQRVR